MPVIEENKRSDYGSYTDLSSLMAYVEKEMKLAVRFEVAAGTEDEPDMVVTYLKQLPSSPYVDWTGPLCPAPIIVGGGNRQVSPAQAYGSALTYAKRYSLQGACGLATSSDSTQFTDTQTRDVQLMSDETKERIDDLLDARSVPPGGEDRYLSGIVGSAVSYRTLTEPVAQRILDAYQKHLENTSNNNHKEMEA
ncbi:ERF family protein [Bifidobacterium cuniculi]|uniref:Prophage replication protein n=1 Tax=Bifidobacterium cuniculi TaxID=1688 RepID=A0A087B4Z1_9BIFI|nr:ERF family protein [Bifidobacterium cuniculi]KFI66091.1 prophage replication protein [Bifidobacterium cuniculi]